jgi:hypothetical protein
MSTKTFDSKTWSKILKLKRQVLLWEQCMSIVLKKKNLCNRSRLVLRCALKELQKRFNLIKSGSWQGLNVFSLQSRTQSLTGVGEVYIQLYEKYERKYFQYARNRFRLLLKLKTIFFDSIKVNCNTVNSSQVTVSQTCLDNIREFLLRRFQTEVV